MQGMPLWADTGGIQSYQCSGSSPLIPILQYFHPIGTEQQQQLQQTGSPILSHCQDYFGRKARQVHRPGMVLKQTAASPRSKVSYVTSFTSKLNNNYELNTKMFNFLNPLFHVKKKKSLECCTFPSSSLNSLSSLSIFRDFFPNISFVCLILVLQIPSHVIIIYL